MLDDRGYEGVLIRGQNPALLMEKAVRDRITESYYWKEQCFGLNAATLCDRAVELTFIGGTYGQQKPTPFLCLAFKLLQLTPEREIVLEYLHNKDFKCVHTKFAEAIVVLTIGVGISERWRRSTSDLPSILLISTKLWNHCCRTTAS